MNDFIKKRKTKYEFYSHCVACDQRLNQQYTSTGLCGECLRITNRCKVQELVDDDNLYVQTEMYRNPMGSIEESLFEPHTDEEDWD